MAFCANCGSQVDGRFCPKCGAAVNVAGGGNVGAAAAPTAAPVASSSGLTENVASALCYALGLITGILFLVLAPYNQNRTIRFHAFQSIFFHVAMIVVWIGISILSVVSHGLTFLLWPLIGLAFFIGWLILLIKAYQGQKLVLPVIGPIAEQQAGR